MYFSDYRYNIKEAICTSGKMADDDDFISTDNQFLIDYYWEDLVKRINISSSILLDALLENGTITQEEEQILRVFVMSLSCNINLT